jgi:hypothetical protein
MGDRRPTSLLGLLRTLRKPPSVTSDFLRTLQSNRFSPNIQAITAMQAHVPLHDVAQLAFKAVEVMPPSCVARLSSSCDDISILTVRIDQLAQQVAVLSTSVSPPRSPLQRRSPAPYICWNNRRFKEIAKRCNVYPVHGSRETWLAVASGGKQCEITKHTHVVI